MQLPPDFVGHVAVARVQRLQVRRERVNAIKVKLLLVEPKPVGPLDRVELPLVAVNNAVAGGEAHNQNIRCWAGSG